MFAGIDFSSGVAIIDTNGALNTPEGCATISDTLGNLMFYTNGTYVWNRLHQIMPNGSGLSGGLNKSSTQSSLIIPKPNSQELFYLFTVDEAQGNKGMRYSIIDMNLDGGNGDIVSNNKDILLFSPSSEKLTAVNHCNDTNVWIVGHGVGNNFFYAYLLDPNSLNMVPIISNVGSIVDSIGFNPKGGQLKFSTDGKKAANALLDIGGPELLSFDNFTGIFSNPILLSITEDRNYGVEFSINSNLLYNLNSSEGKLYQYDISSNDSTTIVNSKILIFDDSSHGLGSMQLAPDGKIYIGSEVLLKKVSVINNPDGIGLSCNFCDTCFNVYPGSGPYRKLQLGLPNFNCSYFRMTSSTGCLNDISEFTNNVIKIYPNPARDWIVLEGKGIKSVEITNALGSEMGSYPISAFALLHKINLSSLCYGIYFLKINMIDEQYQIHKLIVQK